MFDFTEKTVSAKGEEDFAKNLKVLEEGLIKSGHENIMQIDKLAQAKFQENIRFAQWLYNYVSRKNQVLTGYKAYSKRIEAIKQQSIKMTSKFESLRIFGKI